MAGETILTKAICLRIFPWSRTSHVVSWMTPSGRIATVVKGAVRPKSAFLGQYDLNYTCEILYYARAKNDLHALRECSPISLRESLRDNYRGLILADYYRDQINLYAPTGPEAEEWFNLLSRALDSIANRDNDYLFELLNFELAILRLAGLSPEVEAENGAFQLRGERKLPIASTVATCLQNPSRVASREIILEALRAIGLFYSFHLDAPLDSRRSVIKLLK